MLNLSSNDYLGIASNASLRKEFLETVLDMESIPSFGSSSSRLLTGNFDEHDQLEQKISSLYNRESALIFNSGYHMNSGIIPPLMEKGDLILSDKLNHASIIDGILLSKAEYYRFNHGDIEQLELILEKHRGNAKNAMIITESLFSMDGDIPDLVRITELSKKYNTLLYVDEAHSFGVYGKQGLGLCEELNIIDKVDIIGGTFGKSAASTGAFIVCENEVKELLINKCRSVIFSTNISPLQTAWTRFVLDRIVQMQVERCHLKNISTILTGGSPKLIKCDENWSMITPIITGTDKSALDLAEFLQSNGYYALPIRPPTVPVNSARVRLSLTADMTFEEVTGLSIVIRNEI